MKRFRWDIVLAAALIAAGLIAHGMLQRYDFSENGMIRLDRATGTTCSFSDDLGAYVCFSKTMTFPADSAEIARGLSAATQARRRAAQAAPVVDPRYDWMLRDRADSVLPVRSPSSSNPN